MNYLKAVFWDYPPYTDSENLRKFLQENKNIQIYLWILRRFLEYGRVVDALKYFQLQEISKQLPKIKLSPYAEKKWKRIIKVYRRSHRK